MESKSHTLSPKSLFHKLQSNSTLSSKERSSISSYIRQLNSQAIQTLSKSSSPKLKEVYKYLLLAEDLTNQLLRSVKSKDEYRHTSKLQSVTYSHLGCYFDIRGKFITALEYMDKALKIQVNAQIGPRHTAGTLMNLAKVLGKMQRHEDAVKYIEEGIVVLEKEDEIIEGLEITKDLVSAYYYYATELECLERTHEARSFYSKAYTTALEKMGESDPLTQKIIEKLRNIDNSTLPLSTVKSAESSIDTDRMSNTIVLYSQLNSIHSLNYKIIILDKPLTLSIKILAFPSNSSAILRLNLPYSSLSSICPHSIHTSISDSLCEEAIQTCMNSLVQLLYIERNRLKLSVRSIACKLHRVSAEKEGARYSAVIGIGKGRSRGDKRESLYV